MCMKRPDSPSLRLNQANIPSRVEQLRNTHYNATVSKCELRGVVEYITISKGVIG